MKKNNKEKRALAFVLCIAFACLWLFESLPVFALQPDTFQVMTEGKNVKITGSADPGQVVSLLVTNQNDEIVYADQQRCNASGEVAFNFKTDYGIYKMKINEFGLGDPFEKEFEVTYDAEILCCEVNIENENVCLTAETIGNTKVSLLAVDAENKIAYADQKSSGETGVVQFGFALDSGTYTFIVNTPARPEPWTAAYEVAASELPAPQDFKITGHSGYLYALSWSEVSGVGVSYDLYRNGVFIANTADTAYTLKILGNASLYVVAKNAAGQVSAPSTALTISSGAGTTVKKTLALTNDEAQNLYILARQVPFGTTSVTLTFNEQDLEVLDLSTFTPALETNTCSFQAAGLEITRQGGTVSMTRSHRALAYMWTGIFNIVRFKALKTGSTEVTITY